MAYPGTPVGQLFCRSSLPTTPTLQDIQENNLGEVSSGAATHPMQLHPENSQVMSPNSAGLAQPLRPAPLTSSLALEIKAPTTLSLASPQLSLARAATLIVHTFFWFPSSIGRADAGHHPAE